MYKAAQEGVQDVIADMDGEPLVECLGVQLMVMTDDDDDGEQPAAAAQYRELPSAELDGLWDK